MINVANLRKLTFVEAIRGERRRVVKIKPVKIQKRGNSYQLYYYNPRGERRRISVGNDYQQAQRLAVKFNDWLMEGKDPESELELTSKFEKARNITFREFLPIFMKRHGENQSPKMQMLYHTCFNNICRCPELADLPLKSISKGIMLDYMQQRMKLDMVAPATVNREASFMKGVLSRATEWDILDRNPLRGLRMFKEAEKRNVDLSPKDIMKLLQELPKQVANIVEFAVYFGFRRENILSLKIETIRFHDLTHTGEVELDIKGEQYSDP